LSDVPAIRPKPLQFYVLWTTGSSMWTASWQRSYRKRQQGS